MPLFNSRVDVMGSESPYGVFISGKTSTAKSAQRGQAQFDASRQGKKVLNSARDEKARRVP